MPKRQRSSSPAAARTPRMPRLSTASDGSGRDHSSTSTSKHDTSAQPQLRARHSISDLFPFQEIFLRILSFLPPGDLANVQGVNRYWATMSVDQQLWKTLYLSRYPHPHRSRLVHTSASPTTPSPNRPLRPIARLPSRAFPPPSPSRSSSLASLTAIAQTPDRSSHSQGLDRRAQGIGHATPLSSRAVDMDEVGYGVRHDGVDWKMMLRLGTNWSNGNALSQATIPLPPSPSPSAPGSISTLANDPPPLQASSYSEQHIALFPSFIFTSNPESPLVQVHPATNGSQSRPLGIIPPPPKWSSPSRPDNVTAICADQSVVLPEDDSVANGRGHIPARLAVFYQSGGFVVLTVRMTSGGNINWVRESIHPPTSRPRSIRRRATTYSALEGDMVVLATLHYPVLLTCTQGFHLSVYSLEPTSATGESSRPQHLQTMHSDVSFHPAALSLFPLTDAVDANKNGDTHFRAALTYCTPLYPSSWTVAVQEFNVDSTPTAVEQVRRGECWHVARGHHADQEEELIWPRKVVPVIGVKGKQAVGVGMDGRWCVLAGEDNQIQVYSLPTPSPSPSPSEHAQTAHSDISIVHSQTLLAHSAAVSSISLSAGRCVSGGKDGRVLVWELDQEAEHMHGRIGRTVGYVEVRPGGRRSVWRGAAGPDRAASVDDLSDLEEQPLAPLKDGLPHPQAISSAARSLFLPRPPMEDAPTGDVGREDSIRAIRHLAFDEEKIVGLIRGGGTAGEGAEVMKVWNFG